MASTEFIHEETLAKRLQTSLTTAYKIIKLFPQSDYKLDRIKIFKNKFTGKRIEVKKYMARLSTVKNLEAFLHKKGVQLGPKAILIPYVREWVETQTSKPKQPQLPQTKPIVVCDVFQEGKCPARSSGCAHSTPHEIMESCTKDPKSIIHCSHSCLPEKIKSKSTPRKPEPMGFSTKNICIWPQWQGEDGVFQISCGPYIDEYLNQPHLLSKFKFCPNCGGKIVFENEPTKEDIETFLKTQIKPTMDGPTMRVIKSNLNRKFFSLLSHVLRKEFAKN